MEHYCFVKFWYKMGDTGKETNNLLKVTLSNETSSRPLQTSEKHWESWKDDHQSNCLSVSLTDEIRQTIPDAFTSMINSIKMAEYAGSFFAIFTQNMVLQNMFHAHRWIKLEPINHLQTQLATSWAGWKFHKVNYNSWWDVGPLARWQNYPHGLKEQNIAEWLWTSYLAFSSTVKVWCIMSPFLEYKQWIKNSTWLFYAVHNKSFQRNDWSWKNIIGFLITMFPLIQCSMSSNMSQKKFQSFDSHSTTLKSLHQTLPCCQTLKLA